MGKIEAINITNISEDNTFYVNQATLEKGKGIVNDRYYGNFKEKKEQVTLINLEEINNFNNQIKQNIDAKDFRRNIIISGINLNKLINKKIKIKSRLIKFVDLRKILLINIEPIKLVTKGARRENIRKLRIKIFL